MREFPTGATRDSDDNKLDYEGFLSPLVLRRYAEYMHKHRVQADGGVRDSDNWQKGMPRDQYMKSAWRHFMDWWNEHRHHGLPEEACCALLFNVMGYLHEDLTEQEQGPPTEPDVAGFVNTPAEWTDDEYIYYPTSADGGSGIAHKKER